MTLSGKAGIVTGGAKRIGRAIALELAAAGAAVAVHYRRSRFEAEAVVAEIECGGGRAAAISADLSVPAEAAALAAAAVARLDRLDFVVAAAAEFRRTPLERVSEADWESLLQTNVVGPFFLMRKAAELMRKSGEGGSGGGGAIVAVADIAGISPYRGYLPYSVSKAALLALVKGLAQELAPEIRVNAVAPGAVLAPEDAEEAKVFECAAARSPLGAAGKRGSAEDVARAVRFLLEEPSFMTGAVIALDGGRLYT